MALEQLKKMTVNDRVMEAVKKAHDYQPKLNAMVTFVDPKEQLDNLENIDKNAKLYGMPIVAKDNFNTKGIRTTASSRILDDYIPFYDATAIKKLKEAGAIIIGKSSMDELGMGGTNLSAATGPVCNPYDLERISGGSSGGSAALVASGVVPCALGTDTGDSIRKPAGYCGIVGVKPTYGLISRYGVIPYASSLDHVGYFTRNVKDACTMLEVMAGRDDHDMTSSNNELKEYSKLLNGDIKGKKIAVLDNVYSLINNPQMKEAFDKLLAGLKEKGAIIEMVSFDNDLLRTCLPVYYIISNCEASANHSNLDGIRFGVQKGEESYQDIMIKSRTAGFSSLIRKRFVVGSYGLFNENQERLFRKAQKVRRLIVERLKEIVMEYDVLMAPTSLEVAPKIKESSNNIDKLSNEYLIAENYMCIGNFSGYPSMTLPYGYMDKMPIGVNITAKAFGEEEMFDIALAIEEVTGLADTVKEVA